MKMETIYYTIHKWLSVNHPKSGKCDFCGSVRKTAHALKKGKKVERNRDNYFELCYPCHAKYDESPLKGFKVGKKLLNHPNTSRPVNQYDLEGRLVATYVSISEACRVLGKKWLSGDISRVCKHEQITAGGFKWAYATELSDLLEKKS